MLQLEEWEDAELNEPPSKLSSSSPLDDADAGGLDFASMVPYLSPEGKGALRDAMEARSQRNSQESSQRAATTTALSQQQEAYHCCQPPKGGAQYRHGPAVAMVCGDQSMIQSHGTQQASAVALRRPTLLVESLPRGAASPSSSSHGLEGQLYEALQRCRESEEKLASQELEMKLMRGQVVDGRAAVSEASLAYQASKQHAIRLEEKLRGHEEQGTSLDGVRQAFSEFQDKYRVMEAKREEVERANSALRRRVSQLEDELVESQALAEAKRTASQGRIRMQARLASVSPKHCEECRDRETASEALGSLLTSREEELRGKEAELRLLRAEGLRQQASMEAELSQRVESSLSTRVAACRMELEASMAIEVSLLSRELKDSQEALVSATEYIVLIQNKSAEMQEEIEQRRHAEQEIREMESPADPETPVALYSIPHEQQPTVESPVERGRLLGGSSPLGYVRSIGSTEEEGGSAQEEGWLSAKEDTERRQERETKTEPAALASSSALRPSITLKEAAAGAKPRSKPRYLQKTISRLKHALPHSAKPSPPHVALSTRNINSPTAFQV